MRFVTALLSSGLFATQAFGLELKSTTLTDASLSQFYSGMSKREACDYRVFTLEA